MTPDLSDARRKANILTRDISLPELPAFSLSAVRTFASFTVGIMAVVVLVYALLGLTARPMSDDYAFPYSMHINGFWGDMVIMDLGWYGRWACHLAINIAFVVGAWTIPFIPAALILVWVWTNTLALGTMLQQEAKRVLPLALLVVGLTLVVMPDPYGSIYWLCSSMGHALPYILMPLLVPLIARAKERSINRAWLFLLAFCLGGMSEHASAVICAVLLIAWAMRRDWPAFIALIATCAGTVLQVTAPGNAMRMLYKPPTWPLGKVLARTWAHSNLFISSLPTWVWLCLLAAFILALSGIAKQLRVRWWMLPLTWAGAFLAVFMANFASFYGLNLPPVDRSVPGAAYGIAVAAVLTGLFTGAMCGQWFHWSPEKRQRSFTVALAVWTWLLVSSVVPLTQHTVSYASSLIDLAARWDARDSYIRERVAAGDRVITVPAVSWRDIPDISVPSSSGDGLLVNHYIGRFYSMDNPVEIKLKTN